jgi:hypothetical protein
MTSESSKRNRISTEDSLSEANEGSAKRLRTENGSTNGTSTSINPDSKSVESQSLDFISNLFSESDRLYEGEKRKSMTESYASSTPYSSNLHYLSLDIVTLLYPT